MVILIVKNFVKVYKGCCVVEDVSLIVNFGEIVGLLGLNGVGKIIIFYMVVGIVLCDVGNIIIDDDDISLLLLYVCVCCGIGYLLQEVFIFCCFSVYDNLMVVL